MSCAYLNLEQEKQAQQRSIGSSDSSHDGEIEKRKHSKAKTMKGKRSNRKARRNAALDDTNSETFSESFMSQSLANGWILKERNGNVIQQLLISSKMLLCNLPLSASAISFSIVLLGMVWLKWTKEILSSCKEVKFHSSQCMYPEFPGV